MFTYSIAVQGQGNENAVLNALRTGASAAEFDRLRAAYAYATAGGAVELSRALRAAMRDWEHVEKRWLVSMDWGHTEPSALEYLASLENSQVRVPFATEVLANGLVPRRCFHPKTMILDRAATAGRAPVTMSIGSANLTVSGLRTGFEDVSVASWTGGRLSTAEITRLAAMELQTRRLDTVWNSARRLTPFLIRAYADARPRRRPRSEDSNVRVLEIERRLVADYERIAALQTAANLWVEVRYVVENLGAGVPGNQIDLVRGTRVFFGLDPRRVAPNTALGSIALRYGVHTTTRNMRFGNNSMDKLDLPIPGAEGPTTYENTHLIFSREGAGRFELQRGTTAEIARWRRASTDSHTLFRMNSGREWGVF
jgi:hypothetical protein